MAGKPKKKPEQPVENEQSDNHLQTAVEDGIENLVLPVLEETMKDDQASTGDKLRAAQIWISLRKQTKPVEEDAYDLSDVSYLLSGDGGSD